MSKAHCLVGVVGDPRERGKLGDCGVFPFPRLGRSCGARAHAPLGPRPVCPCVRGEGGYEGVGLALLVALLGGRCGAAAGGSGTTGATKPPIRTHRSCSAAGRVRVPRPPTNDAEGEMRRLRPRPRRRPSRNPSQTEAGGPRVPLREPQRRHVPHVRHSGWWHPPDLRRQGIGMLRLSGTIRPMSVRTTRGCPGPACPGRGRQRRKLHALAHGAVSHCQAQTPGQNRTSGYLKRFKRPHRPHHRPPAPAANADARHGRRVQQAESGDVHEKEWKRRNGGHPMAPSASLASMLVCVAAFGRGGVRTRSATPLPPSDEDRNPSAASTSALARPHRPGRRTYPSRWTPAAVD